MKIFSFFLFFCFTMGFSQKISDYKYIYVPKKFDDFKQENQYNLNKIIAGNLKKKNYTVIESESELRQVSACEVLQAKLQDKSTMFRSKVQLDFIDCNESAIGSISTFSTEKDFALGFQDAVNQALLKVAPSNPSAKILTPVSTKIVVPEKLETYEMRGASLNRIHFDNGSFSLVHRSSAKPMATFYPTSKRDVYFVVLENGDHAIGFDEGVRIRVERPETPNSTLENIVISKENSK